MKRLVFRTAAVTDLRSIATSTRHRWGEEQAATYVGELRSRIKSLRIYPLRYPEVGPSRPGLRKMISGHHMVFYLVTENEIEIIRILHGAMDYAARLGGTAE